MTCDDVIRTYLATLKEGFSCSTAPNGRLCIVTPYLYPDHDNIEVFVREKDGRVLVSDLGETLRYLDSLGLDIVATPNYAFAASQLATGLGVGLRDGVLHKEGAPQEVGRLVFDVLAAAKAIAALVYGSRTYEPATFENEVFAFLEQTAPTLPVVRDAEIYGASQSRYRIDLCVQTPAKNVLVQAVSPRSAASARAKVNATFRMWADIDGAFHQPGQKVSLLNDEAVRFKHEDVNLLSRVSQVHRWTQREAFLAALQT
jgi:hypothetical protein